MKGSCITEKQFCPKASCPLRGGLACRYKCLSDVVDHWDLTHAAAEICTAGKTVAYIAPSTLVMRETSNSLLSRLVDYCGLGETTHENAPHSRHLVVCPNVSS
jgi:hypothetical protein